MNEDKQYLEIITQLATIQANQTNFYRETNEHLRQLNGKVGSHEDKLIMLQIAEKEMMTAITGLSKSADFEQQRRSKLNWLFLERLGWGALLVVWTLGIIVLRKVGILNF